MGAASVCVRGQVNRDQGPDGSVDSSYAAAAMGVIVGDLPGEGSVGSHHVPESLAPGTDTDRRGFVEGRPPYVDLPLRQVTRVRDVGEHLGRAERDLDSRRDGPDVVPTSTRGTVR